MWMPEDNFQESVLPGIELKSLGLVASTFTRSAISLTENKIFLSWKNSQVWGSLCPKYKINEIRSAQL